MSNFGPWKALDSAPRDKPVLLFLPAAVYDTSADGRPSNVQHARVVGWWNGEGWVAGLHRDRPPTRVYPSLWTELVEEPEL